MLWDIRLRLALMLWDLYSSREFMENIEEGTDSFDDNNADTSDDADEKSNPEESLRTGDRKRRYQSLYSNSVTDG